MSKVILDMSMSLDGFIAGPNVDVGQPMGDGGERLHDWMFLGKTGREATAFEEEWFEATGAIIMGRRTFDVGVVPWGDNPTFHAPCFVLSANAREEIVKEGGTTYTFVTNGIEGALEQARAAAGGKNIIVMGGANAAQQYIRAGFSTRCRFTWCRAARRWRPIVRPSRRRAGRVGTSRGDRGPWSNPSPVPRREGDIVMTEGATFTVAGRGRTRRRRNDQAEERRWVMSERPIAVNRRAAKERRI